MQADSSIMNYADPKRMRALCDEIAMPEEVTQAVLDYLDSYDFSRAEPFFLGLQSAETGGEAIKQLTEAIKDDERDGFLSLTVYLLAALRAGERYEEKGIPRSVYLDTMKVFTRFVNEHMVSFEKYGYDRGYWTFRQLSLNLFRLGELEYEMRSFGRGAEYLGGDAEADDLALSVHIPSDAAMTREALEDSYRQAARFIREFYPEFQYKHVYCDTWLLAPALRELLPEGSRILNFQADYQVRHVDEESDSYRQWVYKRKYERDEDLPETTSLARAIKARLLAGGKIGSAFGVIGDFQGKYGQT